MRANRAAAAARCGSGVRRGMRRDRAFAAVRSFDSSPGLGRGLLLRIAPHGRNSSGTLSRLKLEGDLQFKIGRRQMHADDFACV